ncbi:MAG: helix-turn-helix domain-containing protein [Nocardioides sp.]|uniref:ArsR/SmtB family transcription factor n=1 Tax=Nocardioides sp. TaxID=35761 RepID=UPI0039E2E2D3
MPKTHEPVSKTHDPRVLRAIAHPTRARILAELFASGSLRAADLATELGIPANQASFHLRQLAKYGLVEEDPEAARDRRDRVWRLGDDSGIHVDLHATEKEDGGTATAAVFRRNVADWCAFLVRRALESPEGSRSTINDSSLRLTDGEAEEFQRELSELYDRWRDRTRGAGQGRQTYSYLTVLQPYPRLDEDRGPDDAGGR